MTLREKALYHQIHPAKLVIDVSTAIVAAVLLWQQHLLRAIAVGIVLPVITSACVILFADLETQKQSRFGRYVAGSMTPPMEAARVFGVCLFWGGAWYRSVLVCTGGLLVIAIAWARGALFRTHSQG
jgi:hypothetical protein